MLQHPYPGQVLRRADFGNHQHDYEDDRPEVSDLTVANIATSEVWGTADHKPLLDIDFPVRLFPSSSPQHFHLFLDKQLSWNRYLTLLAILADMSIIEHGYLNASLARGYTSVRLPWVVK